MSPSPSKHVNTDPKYWDERYNTEAFAYGTAPNAFLKSKVPSPKKPGAKALCLADGEARNGCYLAQLGYEVTSLDFSPVAREKAMTLAKMRSVNLHYELTDLNTYHLQDNQWDLIVSVFYQPLPQVRQRHYQRVFHALKAEGVFILESKAGSEEKERVRYPGVDELALELQPMEVIFSLESEHILDEGTYHQGRQRTAQILAKKT